MGQVGLKYAQLLEMAKTANFICQRLKIPRRLKEQVYFKAGDNEGCMTPPLFCVAKRKEGNKGT